MFKKKRLVAFLLVFALLIPQTTALAAEIVPDIEEGLVIISDNCVVSNGVALWGESFDDKTVSITVTKEQQIIYSVIQGETATQYIIEKLPEICRTYQFDSDEYWYDLMAYCENTKGTAQTDVFKDTVIAETLVDTGSKAQPYGIGSSGMYNHMVTIYGEPGYVDTLLTTTYEGRQIKIKEILDISVNRSNQEFYEKGMAFATLASSVFAIKWISARFAYAALVNSLIGTFDVYIALNTILQYDGHIDLYQMTAYRQRYGEIAGTAYSSAVRTDIRTGFDNNGNNVGTWRVELNDIWYNPDEDTYRDNSYSWLIQEAYENYSNG